MVASKRPKTSRAVVYGATPSGIVAAVLMARLGVKVLLLEPTRHLGGMPTSGLCATDIIKADLIQGISREVFKRAGQTYGSDIEWRPEPHVLSQVFERMLREAGVDFRVGAAIEHLHKAHNAIYKAETSIGTLCADHWIDATYEGDLLPLAQVSFTSGREASDMYAETLAGRLACAPLMPKLADRPIKALDASGKLLPFLTEPDGVLQGQGDNKLQAYCYRLTLTKDPDRRIPFPQPSEYDPARFELFRRIALETRNAGIGRISVAHGTTLRSAYFNLAALPNNKYDMNSGHALPINLPGLNADWLDGGGETRARIANAYTEYTLQLLHFMRTDCSVPENIRKFMSRFGFCNDEYQQTAGLPPMIYVREGRRLVGDFVMTERHVLTGVNDPTNDIGQACYPLDCKPVQWTVTNDGEHAVREGMFFREGVPVYGLPYAVLLPKRREVSNLVVSVAVSASHVAFSSVRMEPHWMTLGAAAGAAVVLSSSEGIPLHDLTPTAVRKLALEPSPPSEAARTESPPLLPSRR